MGGFVQPEHYADPFCFPGPGRVFTAIITTDLRREAAHRSPRFRSGRRSFFSSGALLVPFFSFHEYAHDHLIDGLMNSLALRSFSGRLIRTRF
jgi:hypothetical protein